jgi:hypothetical protein
MFHEGKLPEPEQVDGIGPLWKATTIEQWAYGRAPCQLIRLAVRPFPPTPRPPPLTLCDDVEFVLLHPLSGRYPTGDVL